MFDINLEREFKDFVNDNGWWIGFRHFDLTTKSKYWDESKQAAFDGPIWKHRDFIFKARRVENIQWDGETYQMRQMLTNVFYTVFYIISNVRPKKEDIIIEIPPELRTLSTPPKNIKAQEIFDIKHVEAKIDKKVCYSKCYCLKSVKKNDQTLTGSIPVRYIPI